MKQKLKYFTQSFFLLSIFSSFIYSQTNLNKAVVEYSFRNNSKLAENVSLKMFYDDGFVSYKMEGRISKEKESQFLDLENKQTLQLLKIGDNEKYIFRKSFSEYEEGTITNETENILGYNCKKAIFKIKSNTIEVWYTDELKIKGTPTISIAPGLGLVLKVIRNNDYETFASKIDFRELSTDEKKYNLENAREVDNKTYLRKLIDSRFKTIPIFEHQKINFGDTIVNPKLDQANLTYRFSKGTVLLKKLLLPKLNNGDIVFAEVSQWSNGDAYDRVGSLFIIPNETDTTFLDALKFGINRIPIYKDINGNEFQGVISTKNYEPPLELMRFFTPFGVRKFNDYTQIEGYNWADSIIYRREITDLLPNEGKEIWVGIFIGNYDKGGHVASVNFKIYPSFVPSEKTENVWIKSIFNTVNIMEMSDQNYGTMFHNDSLKVSVNIPVGLENMKLKFTSTGHGGWENGDEFNKKLNEIFIDDKLIYSFIPWRDDCGTFRLSNPSSGNFENGLSSSDLSRSNWCPGTVTVPVEIDLSNLSAGKHTFKIAIPIGEKEGGSFSSWNVSGVLIGKYKN
ncbi:MAG: peptide-N-glycosidase [Ignavibacteriae bacterium]|nr:peptide-N-glycosidase [Ignavibacteriota bacterium]